MSTFTICRKYAGKVAIFSGHDQKCFSPGNPIGRKHCKYAVETRVEKCSTSIRYHSDVEAKVRTSVVVGNPRPRNSSN